MTFDEVAEMLPKFMNRISLTVPDNITKHMLIEYAHMAYHDGRLSALHNKGLQSLKSFVIGVEVGRRLQEEDTDVRPEGTQ